MKDTLVIGMEHKKFAFDRNIEPVAAIHSGDRVIFETEDANVSLITKESDIWAEFPKLYDKGGGDRTGLCGGGQTRRLLVGRYITCGSGIYQKRRIYLHLFRTGNASGLQRVFAAPFRTAHQDLPY